MFNNGPAGDWNGSRVGESSKDLFQDDHLGESSKIYFFSACSYCSYRSCFLSYNCLFSLTGHVVDKNYVSKT